jgi:CHAT domain-containing protein
MIRFYSFLGAGEAPPDALRDTQLAMLSDSDPKLRSPSLWSAFVYEGR